MKKICITLIMLTSLSVISQTQKTYPLDIEKSVLNWTGSYSFFFSKHTGVASFKKGELHTSNGKITGGSFIIDMQSISNEEYKQNIGPVQHLRDSDFFDVQKFPEATLIITSVEYFTSENTHKVLADLTIKGITKSIKFYGTADGTKKTFTTRFKIDRQRWDITYNNKLKNESISDAVEFEVELFF